MRREDGIPEEILPIIFKGGAMGGGNHQPFVPPFFIHPDTFRRVLDLEPDEVDRLSPEEYHLLSSQLVRKLGEPFLSGVRPFNKAPIKLYQLWDMLDWREGHVTSEAAKRFSRKLMEEVGECLAELEKVPKSIIMQRFDNPEDSIPYETDKEVVSELGDVLFTATAGATMIGADCEWGTAVQLLHIYGKSVQYPTVGYVDELVGQGIRRRDETYPAGHLPYFLWHLANHEADPVFDEEPFFNMHALSQPIGSEILIMAEAIEEALVPLTKADVITGYGTPKRMQHEEIIGKLWIFTAYYAQLWGNSSLTDVVKTNMEKISGRVVEGSLDDKTKRTGKTL